MPPFIPVTQLSTLNAGYGNFFHLGGDVFKGIAGFSAPSSLLVNPSLKCVRVADIFIFNYYKETRFKLQGLCSQLCNKLCKGLKAKVIKHKPENRCKVKTPKNQKPSEDSHIGID